MTTEPKVTRWQADPERRAACGPGTGSGAAVLLCRTAGQSREATKYPRNRIELSASREAVSVHQVLPVPAATSGQIPGQRILRTVLEWYNLFLLEQAEESARHVVRFLAESA